ncbi:uncharacterized protein PV09_02566 [Verruconis gallopava]|uniref:N-acetyltransferase domain-containing protein n=1 Tax=Verruconis gallopava TaxID=253628 RepID=A0A0D1XVU8_9PEZI|nr:uncharacterized protein PV09_02566 [Verruconis gallopava]KIW06896.1 hypothetical protein PV09_02566 [Verruconis gallopava]
MITYDVRRATQVVDGISSTALHSMGEEQQTDMADAEPHQQVAEQAVVPSANHGGTVETHSVVKMQLPADLPWPKPIITLPQLVVRPYHPSDVPAIARMANNKKVACNMTDRFPHPYTEQDGVDFMLKALNPKKSNVYAWVVSLTPEGPPIGGCGFVPGTDVLRRNAEIGYWLGEEFWGKGYATLVCDALTNWAFEQEQGITGEKLQRVGAQVYGGNKGSEKVLMKCGYKHEGTMRDIVYKWGEVRDLKAYGMRRLDWEQRKLKKCTH